jgi:hypothetical protein
VTHTNTFLREKRLIFQLFENAGDYLKKKSVDALQKAKKIRDDPFGETEKMVGDLTDAGMRQVERLKNMDLEDLFREVEGGLDEMRAILGTLDVDISRAILGGKEAFDAFMRDPNKAARLKKALEGLAASSAYHFLEILSEWYPDIKESLRKAKLAERALAGDNVARSQLVQENLDARYWTRGIAKTWRWAWKPRVSRKAWNKRLVSDRKKIDEAYTEQLEELHQKYTFLEPDLVRRIVQAGVPAYVAQ